MSKPEVQGLNALVTGAASGIGAAVARRMAEEGAHVAGLDRQPMAELALHAVADLGDGDAVAQAVAALAQQAGAFDVLVHCAGYCPSGGTLEGDDAQWLETYSVNVLGALRVMRLVVPAMRRSGGSIVLVSSINARFATPSLAAYAASKAALEAMSRTAALEFARDGIRVNCIAPASVDTPMLQASFARADDPQLARERNIARHPLGRLGTPQDAAELALFLASPRSAWITGGIFPLDGGAGVTRR